MHRVYRERERGDGKESILMRESTIIRNYIHREENIIHTKI